MKELKGIDIKEVWDYRLSTVSIFIDNRGATWKVVVMKKRNQDYDPKHPETLAKPLEVIDTHIPSTINDTWDTNKTKACFEIIYKIRDKYSRPDIEDLKPKVKNLNAATKALQKALAAPI
jgi:hypothetical protein